MVWQACLWLAAPVLSVHRSSLFQLLSPRAQAHLAGRLQNGLPGTVWQLLHHSRGTPHMRGHLCRVHSNQLPAQVVWEGHCPSPHLAVRLVWQCQVHSDQLPAQVIPGDLEGALCVSTWQSVGIRDASSGLQSGAHKGCSGQGAPSWLFSLPASLAAPFFLRLPLAKAPLAAAARISSRAEGLHSSIKSEKAQQTGANPACCSSAQQIQITAIASSTTRVRTS